MLSHSDSIAFTVYSDSFHKSLWYLTVVNISRYKEQGYNNNVSGFCRIS